MKHALLNEFSFQNAWFINLRIVNHLLQACILAVGRGNKVVEPVIGADGINLWMFSMPLNAKILSCFDIDL